MITRMINSEMISKTKTYSINTVKLLIFSLIIVFLFHPLSVTPVQVCSPEQKNTECNKCCCCSENNECCCEGETDSEKSSEILCVCKFSTSEPAEEQKSPVNLNTNLQKLFAGFKSDIPVKSIESDNNESLNVISIKSNTSALKSEIYLEISSLRI